MAKKRRAHEAKRQSHIVYIDYKDIYHYLPRACM